jgi:putative endonuclease
VAEGFTKRYAVSRLVFWEETSDVRAAITREKQLKSWGRERKLALIRSVNPRFRDLAEEVE